MFTTLCAYSNVKAARNGLRAVQLFREQQKGHRRWRFLDPTAYARLSCCQISMIRWCFTDVDGYTGLYHVPRGFDLSSCVNC